MSIWSEAVGTMWPGRNARDGPLPPLLLLLTVATGDPAAGSRRYTLIALLAFAMGIQNASVRRLAVPELTTTVLTMTLTGIAADSSLAGGAGARFGRRGLAVAAMFVGALIGALLALRVNTLAPLVAAAATLTVTAMAAQQLSK